MDNNQNRGYDQNQQPNTENYYSKPVSQNNFNGQAFQQSQDNGNYQRPNYQRPNYQEPNYSNQYQSNYNHSNPKMVPEEISVLKYLGLTWLGLIPLVGLIVYIVMAFSSNSGINTKNYAKAALLNMIIMFVLAVFWIGIVVNLIYQASAY